MAINAWKNFFGTTNSSSSLQGYLGLGLGVLFSAAVWVSTLFVGRLASIFVVAMGISFVIATSGMIPNLSITELFNPAESQDSHLACLLYTSPSPRDATLSRMPSSA